MAESMNNQNGGTIGYRLSVIEKTLSELKDVVIENKLQQRDISDLRDKMDEILSAINAHEKRIRLVEDRPLKEKADKWQYIVDYIFKGIVSVAIIAFLAKLNISL